MVKPLMSLVRRNTCAITGVRFNNQKKQHNMNTNEAVKRLMAGESILMPFNLIASKPNWYISVLYDANTEFFSCALAAVHDIDGNAVLATEVLSPSEDFVVSIFPIVAYENGLSTAVDVIRREVLNILENM